MKKYIIVGVLLLFPSLTFASFNQNLKVGMSGNDVSDLQDILTTEGCFSHASTGYFGVVTLNAVKCFQDKNNISSTGYVGVLTRGALNTILSGAIESSNQAEIQETGSIAPVTTNCPSGYVCNPVNVVLPSPFPTPTQPNAPILGSQTPTPTPIVKPLPSVAIGKVTCESYSTDNPSAKELYFPFIITNGIEGRVIHKDELSIFNSSGVLVRSAGGGTNEGSIKGEFVPSFEQKYFEPGEYTYILKVKGIAEDDSEVVSRGSVIINDLCQ